MKGLLKFVRWFLFFYIKSPAQELYIRNKDRRNRNYYQDCVLSNGNSNLYWFGDVSPRSIPKKIWLFWEQGEDEAPEVVRRCIDSWRNCNPEWELNILSGNTVADFVKVPDLPDYLPIQGKADLIRLLLLDKYGGVWVDSTLFCHRSLDGWLPFMASSGFFVFRNPGPSRFIENWFIASTPGNLLVGRWVQEMIDYLEGRKFKNPAYFVAFYIFQWLVKTDPDFKREFSKVSGYSAFPTFLLHEYLEGRSTGVECRKFVELGLPVSKLNWRGSYDLQKLKDVEVG